ncbi:MAG: tRNA (N6-threonylcarbamoyladenosine(37)-N6)-methyltransferase TrmO [Chloroflexi bacterium]|nr:tRNA (N6-threonylcarbamoyladenosine(37)-N6)-methyltransferase TrmO [Chloroflexota bacterium]
MNDRKIEVKPIGVVRTSLSREEVRAGWSKGVAAEIEVFPEYAEALEGIDGFSHLMVVLYMHETTEEQRRTLRQRPRRFLKYGLKLEDLPLVGVFSLDSPHRPNPIGLTIMRLLERHGTVLKVEGSDAFDNTPVLDIKPYTLDRCQTGVEQPGWLKALLDRTK